jgi:hypothetical protein
MCLTVHSAHRRLLPLLSFTALSVIPTTECRYDWLAAKLRLALATEVILIFEPHRAHGHTLLPGGFVSLYTT